MKVSIELNEEKIALARKLGKLSTLKQLIDRALDAYIKQLRRQSMADLLGTNFYEGEAKVVRKSLKKKRR